MSSLMRKTLRKLLGTTKENDRSSNTKSEETVPPVDRRSSRLGALRRRSVLFPMEEPTENKKEQQGGDDGVWKASLSSRRKSILFPVGEQSGKRTEEQSENSGLGRARFLLRRKSALFSMEQTANKAEEQVGDDEIGKTSTQNQTRHLKSPSSPQTFIHEPVVVPPPPHAPSLNNTTSGISSIYPSKAIWASQTSTTTSAISLPISQDSAVSIPPPISAPPTSARVIPSQEFNQVKARIAQLSRRLNHHLDLCESFCLKLAVRSTNRKTLILHGASYDCLSAELRKEVVNTLKKDMASAGKLFSQAASIRQTIDRINIRSLRQMIEEAEKKPVNIGIMIDENEFGKKMVRDKGYKIYLDEFNEGYKRVATKIMAHGELIEKVQMIASSAVGDMEWVECLSEEGRKYEHIHVWAYKKYLERVERDMGRSDQRLTRSLSVLENFVCEWKIRDDARI